MKTNDIPRVQYKTTTGHFENILNVYTDKNDKYFYNLLKTVYVPEDLDSDYYVLHTVKFGEMWPTISYKYYGDVVLWWIICATNQIEDATKNPIPGTIIKIIKPHYVTKILNEIE